MALNSTAELLFRIGANIDEADQNIQALCTLLGKDLSGLKDELHDGSKNIFGDLSTVQGAPTAASTAWQLPVMEASLNTITNSVRPLPSFSRPPASTAQSPASPELDQAPRIDLTPVIADLSKILPLLPQLEAGLKKNETQLTGWGAHAVETASQVQRAFTEVGATGHDALMRFDQAMGANIASAIVHGRSISDAMRSALAATLESIAAESLVQAIYSTALGFLRLAQWDFAGAESAFTAAAIFGTVGGAAAVAGKFATSQTGAGSAQGRAGGSTSTGTQTPASTPTQQGPSVHVYVQGNLVGWNNIDELTQAINDAVLNRDVTLTATNTTSGVQVVR